MKIFSFELEEKLEQHCKVKFDGEFDGNGLEALKLLNFEQLPRGFDRVKLCFCDFRYIDRVVTLSVPTGVALISRTIRDTAMSDPRYER